MHDDRLREIMDRFSDLSILVVGDFFLDEYLITDPSLTETSIETGLDAYQVVDRRCSPGAAGTVTNNLSALGTGSVMALSVIGEDGNGYDLTKGLAAAGVDTSALIATPDRFTPTYSKPMVRRDDSERELNRLDIKNRSPTSSEIEDTVIAALKKILPEMDGVIVSDQVQERNQGVVTDRVRESICSLAASYSNVTVLIDSRVRIGEYRNVILKPNRDEAIAAASNSNNSQGDIELVKACGRELVLRSGKPVFVTLSEDGMLIVTEAGVDRIPAIKVLGPIDPVGAGDSTAAGITTALCAGATLTEAATIANRIASIVVQQLGTTGTAAPGQVLELDGSV